MKDPARRRAIRLCSIFGACALAGLTHVGNSSAVLDYHESYYSIQNKGRCPEQSSCAVSIYRAAAGQGKKVQVAVDRAICTGKRSDLEHFRQITSTVRSSTGTRFDITTKRSQYAISVRGRFIDRHRDKFGYVDKGSVKGTYRISGPRCPNGRLNFRAKVLNRHDSP